MVRSAKKQPMSTTTYYTVFDGAVLDSVWRLTWKEFFRRHPRSRAAMRQLIAFGYNPEPSEEEIAAIFDTKTVAWTIRHSTPQLYVMSELMYFVPKLRQRSLDIPTYFSEDWLGLIAAGIDTWMRGRIGGPTLSAILKLHGFFELGRDLDLPKRVVGRVKKLIRLTRFSTPLYRWQWSDFTDYDCCSCLNVEDTKRFVAFISQAWNDNRPIPFLRPDTGRGLSVDVTAAVVPAFQQLDVARTLAAKLRVIRTYKRPRMFHFLT